MARTAVICHSGPESDSHSGPVSGVGIKENIRGNASERIKSLAAAVFFHFVDAKGTSYGADVGRKLKFAEINISGSEPSSLSERRDVELVERQGVGNELSVETVFEVVVDRDMCNIYGSLHGGCAAYLVDPCSSASLVALGLLLGVDGTGVSQSMNLIWHRPIYEGTKITIRSTSVFMTGKIRTARCEIWAGNRLCISAVHSTINPMLKNPKAKL